MVLLKMYPSSVLVKEEVVMLSVNDLKNNYKLSEVLQLSKLKTRHNMSTLSPLLHISQSHRLFLLLYNRPHHG